MPENATGRRRVGHAYYDHASVLGDTTSQLRDALLERGFDAVIAHTGGGCMSVEVILTEHVNALVGVDDDLKVAVSGGADIEDHRLEDWFVSGHYFQSQPGEMLDTIVEWLTRMKKEVNN